MDSTTHAPTNVSVIVSTPPASGNFTIGTIFNDKAVAIGADSLVLIVLYYISFLSLTAEIYLILGLFLDILEESLIFEKKR